MNLQIKLQHIKYMQIVQCKKRKCEFKKFSSKIDMIKGIKKEEEEEREKGEGKKNVTKKRRR